MTESGDELSSLTPADSVWYSYCMDKPSEGGILGAREVGRRRNQLAAKLVLDGTKLPMVVEPSQIHYIWYALLFPVLFDR